MKIRTWSFLAAAALTAAALSYQPAITAAPQPQIDTGIPDERHDVLQIAILLDTSNSMDGLIMQAKGQLWDIVNELIKSQKGGRALDIEVALYQYGTPELGMANNYIKQLTPLTGDLDKVSAELSKLRTRGGDEYCGAAIRQAVEDLKWSDNKEAFKAIFIAGNEPFTQGPVDYHLACKAAKAKGIVVNTIFCGKDQEGIQTNWKDGATIAGGVYSSIDQGQQFTRVETPQDKRLAELSAKLNATYVPYGKAGVEGAKNQAAQDAVAAESTTSNTAAAIERAIAKASGAYRNAAWDLVDAVKEKRIDLKSIAAEDLPEEMRALDATGREDYLAAKQKQRTEIQAEIKSLDGQRDKFIAAAAEKNRAPEAAAGRASKTAPNYSGAAGAAGGAGAGRGSGGGGFGGAVVGGARQGR